MGMFGYGGPSAATQMMQGQFGSAPQAMPQAPGLPAGAPMPPIALPTAPQAPPTAPQAPPTAAPAKPGAPQGDWNQNDPLFQSWIRQAFPMMAGQALGGLQQPQQQPQQGLAPLLRLFQGPPQQ